MKNCPRTVRALLRSCLLSSDCGWAAQTDTASYQARGQSAIHDYINSRINAGEKLLCTKCRKLLFPPTDHILLVTANIYISPILPASSLVYRAEKEACESDELTSHSGN